MGSLTAANIVEERILEREHESLRIGLSTLQGAIEDAHRLSRPEIAERVARSTSWMHRAFLPHAAWEEAWLFGHLDQETGSPWTTRALRFQHEQIRELVDRGAVIGVAFDAWMLAPGWVRGTTTPQSAGVTLETVIDHIDRICQVAGDALHCGIGSDLDGAFGREQCPADVETIADLSRIPPRLAARGYGPDDIANIAHGNFVRFLRHAWA